MDDVRARWFLPRSACDRIHRPRPPGFHSTDRAVSSLATARRSDRKSTRLNSSHGYISYAVFCLKKKKSFAYLCEALAVVGDVDLRGPVLVHYHHAPERQRVLGDSLDLFRSQTHYEEHRSTIPS